jgi:hypothetical protein
MWPTSIIRFLFYGIVNIWNGWMIDKIGEDLEDSGDGSVQVC